MADRMLRLGGWMIVLVETAFDESGTHQESPILCVAGYIMEKGHAQELNGEWNEVLNWKELPHPLEYFHMSDCAHGNGIFKDISKPLRIQIVSRLIAVIKR